MRTIKNKYSIIEKIVGEQTIQKEKYYKHSIYTRLICIRNGENLWYNLFTGEILLLLEEEKESIKFDKKIYSNDMDELIKKRFLVPCDLNEHELCKSVKLTADLLLQNNVINSYTIMTTTDCNARCFYCYELGCKREFMTEKTAFDVADYIIKHYKKQKIHINWFGGEPLYNSKVINIICEELKKSDIDFDSSMISNGYLFDANIIEQAKKYWNLKWVQITLDGTEEVYNKTKAYIYKNTNPFKIVIENIKNLINNQIKVRIRLNLGEYNFEDLKRLTKYLYEYLGRNKWFCVYVSPLYDELKTNGNDVYAKLFELEDYLQSLGIFAKISLNEKYQNAACMADSNSSRLITPTGNIGLCEHFSDSNIIGNIYSKKLDDNLKNSWKETLPEQPKCKSCIFFPECKRIKKCPNNLLTCSDELIKKKIRYLDNSINWYYEKNFKKTGD